MESKTFDIEVDWLGKEKLIRIIERGVGFQARITIRERNARWLCGCLLEAVNLPQHLRLLHSRREDGKIVLSRRRENTRGRYVLVSVLDELGTEKSVAVPEGPEGSGWTDILQGILEVAEADVGLKVGGRKPKLAMERVDDIHGGELLDNPLIGGEIIDFRGRLGIRTCYGQYTTLGNWIER